MYISNTITVTNVDLKTPQKLYYNKNDIFLEYVCDMYKIRDTVNNAEYLLEPIIMQAFF